MRQVPKVGDLVRGNNGMTGTILEIFQDSDGKKRALLIDPDDDLAHPHGGTLFDLDYLKPVACRMTPTAEEINAFLSRYFGSKPVPSDPPIDLTALIRAALAELAGRKRP